MGSLLEERVLEAIDAWRFRLTEEHYTQEFSAEVRTTLEGEFGISADDATGVQQEVFSWYEHQTYLANSKDPYASSHQLNMDGLEEIRRYGAEGHMPEDKFDDIYGAYLESWDPFIHFVAGVRSVAEEGTPLSHDLVTKVFTEVFPTIDAYVKAYENRRACIETSNCMLQLENGGQTIADSEINEVNRVIDTVIMPMVEEQILGSIYPPQTGEQPR